MALGREAINEARAVLADINQKIKLSEDSCSEFKKLLTDANFQKFADQTNRGETINNDFNNIIQWINVLIQTLNNLNNASTTFLNNQESLNE